MAPALYLQCSSLCNVRILACTMPPALYLQCSSLCNVRILACSMAPALYLHCSSLCSVRILACTMSPALYLQCSSLCSDFSISYWLSFFDLRQGRRGRDRMVVGFTTTFAISAYHY